MSEYVATCDLLELEEGTRFVVLPGPVEIGDLALFDFDGFEISGRWYVGWIQLPGRRIEFPGRTPRILGRVVPIDPETAHACLN